VRIVLARSNAGKQADLAVFDVRDYREIPCDFGFNLCVMTMTKGCLIYQAPGY
jgi:imidazolonepropionase-like amidohydrolase